MVPETARGASLLHACAAATVRHTRAQIPTSLPLRAFHITCILHLPHQSKLQVWVRTELLDCKGHGDHVDNRRPILPGVVVPWRFHPRVQSLVLICIAVHSFLVCFLFLDRSYPGWIVHRGCPGRARAFPACAIRQFWCPGRGGWVGRERLHLKSYVSETQGLFTKNEGAGDRVA